MSTYSEDGSEAAVDEDLLRDLDSLREVLEEEETAGSLQPRFANTSGLVGFVSSWLHKTHYMFEHFFLLV